MINFIYTVDDAKKEIKNKISAMQRVLLKFADDESPLVNQIAKETIFNGVGKPSLGVRSGGTKAEGLQSRKFQKLTKKANMVGESFWNHMTNIHDNFKERKRLGLLRRLNKEFKTNSAVEQIFNAALKDFDNVK